MKNIWKPPFTLKYIFVFDNKGQPCFQFNFDTWDNKKNIEIQQEVIDILNDKTDKKITSKLEVYDNEIYMDDKPFITVQGMQLITGYYLDLATATNLAKWICNKLTK